jgi:hypothetical protein
VVSAVTRELLAARNLGTVLHDPFANYVMQTLVTVASDDDINLFVAKVIRSSSYRHQIAIR